MVFDTASSYSMELRPENPGAKKNRNLPQKQESCIFGPNSAQNVVLARAISRNGGFKRGRNRGFGGLTIDSEVQ